MKADDLKLYQDEIAPILPPEVLDFHTHVFKAEHRLSNLPASDYMSLENEYAIEQLEADLALMFPDRPCKAVCFGFPWINMDLQAMNNYTVQAKNQYPFIVAGRGTHSKESLKQELHKGFAGIKVLLNWIGDNYGTVTVDDLIGLDEMNLANEYNLPIMLHVPREGRLADPVVQAGVQEISAKYPNAQIVLAHCGRAYLPDEMKKAVGSVKNLKNVWLDTSMVMDVTTLQIVFDNIPSDRVLYGTDLPIAGMRGRRVYAVNHWVDLVEEGYPPSAYRVASNNFRATYMVYEIILAIRRAADMVGLKEAELKSIFYANGMKILEKVRL